MAWVTCDAADADPIRFISYVGLAVERALKFELPLIDRVGLNAGSALSNAVPRLTSALHNARQPLVIMLDDVHLLAGTPTVDVLADGDRLPAAGRHARRRRPHRRGSADRAPARGWPAGGDRGRGPRPRRAGGRAPGRARRARAAAPRGPRPPCQDRGLAGRRLPGGAPPAAPARRPTARPRRACPAGTPTSATTSTPSSSTTRARGCGRSSSRPRSSTG